jgi:hypothetical protein
LKYDFYYSIGLLKKILDFYFYGGINDKSMYLMKIAKHGGAGSELNILVSDIARAVKILDREEKEVVCFKHSGFTYYEIRNMLRKRKQKIILKIFNLRL